MKKRNLLSDLKLLKRLLQLKKSQSLTEIEDFVKDFYSVNNMPTEFYELLLKKLSSKKVITIISTRNVYKLISHLKNNDEKTDEIEEYLSPQQYFLIPKKYINKLSKLLKEMPECDNELTKSISEEDLWKLRKRINKTEEEYQELAYKLYQIFGLENAMDFINQKFGAINYEQVHYLLKNIEPNSITEEQLQIFKDYIFSNKKDFKNPLRQMLIGRFTELFINFDYFYNKLPYFIKKLGNNLKSEKIRLLLKERFLTTDPTTPELTAEIRDDMLSSYYHKYNALNVSPKEVLDKNTEVFRVKLKDKYKSSIPQIELSKTDEITPELLSLSDPRNLIHGYRAGNCFRINGEASILFSKFLDSEHMRILSFSTPEYKDYAMVLLMRNGNTLIAQGIETSKWVPLEIKGQKLYNATRTALKEIMDYMNQENDEIVATIIGATNENVTNYNQQYLPFLVGPIIENANNYYNGISNYQCLLDLAPTKSIYDIKPFIPTQRYFDAREEILSRKNNYPNQEIERRLIALRYQRCQTEEGFSFYHEISNHREYETTCNKDWYVTLFTDGEIDSFITNTDDERAHREYQNQLKIYQKSKQTKRKS